MNLKAEGIAGLVLVLTLAASACSSGGEPPAAVPEENYLSDIELTQRMFDCIGAAGFEGTIDLVSGQGPNTGFYVPPDRQVAFRQANDDCINGLLDAGLTRPTELPSREEHIERYQYLLDSVPCLREQGVFPSDPPSLETYIESGGAAWVPHGDILDQLHDAEAINAAFRACPQFQ